MNSTSTLHFFEQFRTKWHISPDCKVLNHGSTPQNDLESGRFRRSNNGTKCVKNDHTCNTGFRSMFSIHHSILINLSMVNFHFHLNNDQHVNYVNLFEAGYPPHPTAVSQFQTNPNITCIYISPFRKHPQISTDISKHPQIFQRYPHMVGIPHFHRCARCKCPNWAAWPLWQGIWP